MLNQDNRNNIGRNTVLYAVAQIISKAASYFLLPIYTYYISAEELGMYEYIRSYISVLIIFSGLGLSTYYLRQYVFEKNKKRISGSIYWFLFLWNIVLLILEMLVVPYVMKVLNAPMDFFPLMFMALVYQFMYSFELIPMRTYRIRGEVKQYLIICVIKSSIQVILIILFVKYLSLGIKGRYLSEITVSFVLAVIFVIYMFKNTEHNIDKEVIRKGLSFSIPLVPTELLQTVSTSITAILIERFLSLEQLGNYSIAVSITAVVDVINNSLWYAVEPELYLKASDQNFDEYFIRIKKLYLALVCTICSGAALLMKEAVHIILSPAYVNSWQIVQVISFSYIMAGITSLYYQIVVIEGKTKQLIWINILKLVVVVGMCLILLPILQAKILGWTFFAGYVVVLSLYLIVVKTNIKREKELFKDLCLIALSGLFIFGSRYLPEMSIGMSIILKILLWLTLFLCILWIYGIKIKELMKFIKR